jgi:hypothetical protein
MVAARWQETPRHLQRDRYTATHIFLDLKGAMTMFRKFSSLAIWVVLGVALALAPLACSSDTTVVDSGPGVVDTGVDHVTPDSATQP